MRTVWVHEATNGLTIMASCVACSPSSVLLLDLLVAKQNLAELLAEVTELLDDTGKAWDERSRRGMSARVVGWRESAGARRRRRRPASPHRLGRPTKDGEEKRGSHLVFIFAREGRNGLLCNVAEFV